MISNFDTILKIIENINSDSTLVIETRRNVLNVLSKNYFIVPPNSLSLCQTR